MDVVGEEGMCKHVRCEEVRAACMLGVVLSRSDVGRVLATATPVHNRWCTAHPKLIEGAWCQHRPFTTPSFSLAVTL